jgi:hypothetical protein
MKVRYLLSLLLSFAASALPAQLSAPAGLSKDSMLALGTHRRAIVQSASHLRSLRPSLREGMNSIIQSGVAPRAPLWAIALSAAIPGAGQAAMGVDRAIPYLALESYSWVQYAQHSRDSRQQRNSYRDLAARVARSMFAAFQPVGDFEYYERMENFLESGVFDAVSGGALDPEPDTTTYNGFVWLLARRTYWSSIEVPPDTSSREYNLAIAFYRRRAYDQSYRWSWRNAQLEYDEYRRLIRASNESNRKALQDLGIIIGNHLLSMVDAYITVRLRRRPPAPVGRGAGEWTVVGSLKLPRGLP